MNVLFGSKDGKPNNIRKRGKKESRGDTSFSKDYDMSQLRDKLNSVVG